MPAARPAVDTGRLAAFQADPAPWRDRLIAAARYLDPPLRGSLPEDPP